ncbi:MAG: penicillin-binding protein 2 [Cyanobacteria bacterium]|nr:penicillin-binding protein 2 [Cyanobacteriota bacterium]
MIREDNTKANRIRIFFLFFLFLAAFGFIIYKLVEIQYISAGRYILQADYQHKDNFSLKSRRGKIIDRNGIELASSLIEKTITANPKLIKEPAKAAQEISKILLLDKSDLEKKLSDKDVGFLYIARKINSKDAERIANLKLEGIYVENEAKRFYPQNNLGSTLIGFTGTDNTGLSGLELNYEDILKGIDGTLTAQKDVFGQIIQTNEENFSPPVDGSDIILTIDSQIQFYAETKLREVAQEYKSEKAVAILMNPKTGEIYALAQYPTFDLNKYADVNPQYYNNLGISYTYEPGSTFKIVNISSALDNNTVSSTQVFHLAPSIKVGDRIIKEIHRTYAVDYSLKDIIKYSSNIGAVTVALSMGSKLYYESIVKYGFGNYTGVNLPGEEKGIIADYKTWPASTIGALAIGQSIAITPMQLVRAVSVIANGGYLVTPYVVSEIKSANGTIEKNKTADKVRIISQQTSQTLKDMMLSVVEEGTGKQAGIDGIKVCGKTGTAQKANKNGSGYDEGLIVTSFVGFAPYEDPRIACVIIIDEPQGNENAIWGGTVAAPVFSDLVNFALNKIH